MPAHIEEKKHENDKPPVKKPETKEPQRWEYKEREHRDLPDPRDVQGLEGQPVGPTQQAILGGETVTIATVTLGSLLSSLFVTNTAPSAPTTATWVAPGVLQGQYGDFSLFTIRFEARAYLPSKIQVT